MERDDAEAAPGRQEVGGLRERRLEAPQLVVDRDAERLERSGRGVDPPGAPVWWNGRGHQLRQLSRAGDGPPGPGRHETPRDPPGRRLLAVGGEQPRQLGLGGPVHELGGRHGLVGIESHVEPLVDLEGEAPTAVDELVGGEPEVEQDRVRRVDAGGAGLVGEVAEVGVAQAHARPVPREPPSREGERRRITVEPEQPRVGRVLEERGGMPAEPDRPVHDPGCRRHRGEPAQDLREEHRLVAARFGDAGRRGRLHRAQSPSSASLLAIWSKLPSCWR